MWPLVRANGITLPYPTCCFVFVLKVNRHDIDRFRSIMSSQAKRAFPQYNCQRFFMDPSLAGSGGAGQQLIFNFCAEGEYVQVESTDILR